MPAPVYLRPLFAQYGPILRTWNVGDIIDSHDFIQRLTQRNQKGYIDALHHMVYVKRSRTPFRTLHRILATRLLHETTLVQQRRNRPRTEDVFGDVVSNSEWERI